MINFMKKIFTNYLFILFIVPIFIFVIGVALTPSSGIADLEVQKDATQFDPSTLGDSFKNSALFFATYTIYFFSYFVLFLIRRTTNFKWSVAHFLGFLINFLFLAYDAESVFLIPLTVITIVFFILNIFKASRKITP